MPKAAPSPRHTHQTPSLNNMHEARFQLLRNVPGSVYLLGHFLHESASAYEMSKREMGGWCRLGGRRGAVQRITVTLEGRDWTVCECVCVALP